MFSGLSRSGPQDPEPNLDTGKISSCFVSPVISSVSFRHLVLLEIISFRKSVWIGHWIKRIIE